MTGDIIDSEQKENPSSGAGFLLWGLYLLPLVVLVPYNNWQYAQQNGFLKWLFFGEFVASIQAFLWPYYLLKDFLF